MMTNAVSNFSTSQFLNHTIILTDNLFPQLEEKNTIPLDIADLILKNSTLLPENFLNMMKVSRSWFRLINEDQEFYKKRIFLPLCIARAKQSSEKSGILLYKIKILIEIAQFDPEHCFKRVNELMKSLKFSDQANFYMYSDIALIQARFKTLSLALETVENVKKQSEQLKILHNIAVVLSQDGRHLEAIDIAKKIESLSNTTSVFMEIAVVEASHNLDNARDSASYIRDPYDQFLAYMAIAEFEFTPNLILVKQSLHQIDDPLLKFKALIKIAKVEPEGDYFIQAKLLVAEIEDFDSKLDALLEIVEIDPDYINEVIEFVQEIEDPEDRFLVFCELVKKNHKSVLTQLTETVEEIFNPLKQGANLLHLVKLLIPIDLEQAKFFANTIKCPVCKSFKVEAYIEIATYESLQGLDLARKTLEYITDLTERQTANIILDKLVNFSDLKMVKLKAQEIQEPVSQSFYLFNVVKLQSKFDLKLAFQTAGTIIDPNQRGWAFLEILKVFT